MSKLNRTTKVLMISGAVIGQVGLFVAILWSMYRDHQRVGRAAELFLRRCTIGEHDAAYDSAAPALRAVTSREQLVAECNRLTSTAGVYQHPAAIHTSDIRFGFPRTATIEGELTFEKDTIPVRFTLTKSGGTWRVVTMQTAR